MFDGIIFFSDVDQDNYMFVSSEAIPMCAYNICLFKN